jgi:hypothetical protein
MSENNYIQLNSMNDDDAGVAATKVHLARQKTGTMFKK